MKNRYISKTKKATRVALFFTFLQISLMAGLIEDSWILLSAPSFSLWPYVVLVEDRKKIWPHTDTYLEKRNISIAFSDNCGYFSLILYQNLTNGISIMFRCRIGSRYQYP